VVDVFTHSGFFALIQVVLIDMTLAGDNAVVIGMAAAPVPKADRRKVILLGLMAAVALRVVLAVFAVSLLAIIPLTIAGGILLLWVCWRLWRDLRQEQQQAAPDACAAPAPAPAGVSHAQAMRRAVLHITLADISMSLDNVLAVAGAARHHVSVLVIGLLLSVALMGLAANLIAKLLQRHPWISYAGIFIVLFVALRMIWEGVAMMGMV
jgi:YjbE family integral membrane protein